MIADKFIDLYARNSGLRDKLIAERDVVLTYARFHPLTGQQWRTR